MKRTTERCSHILASREMKEISRVIESMDFTTPKALENITCPKAGYIYMHNKYFCQAHYSDYIRSAEYDKYRENVYGIRSSTNTNIIPRESGRSTYDRIFKPEAPIVVRVKGCSGYHQGKRIETDTKEEVKI